METGLETLPLWPANPPAFVPQPWEIEVYDKIGSPGVDLLSATLQLCPLSRISAKDVCRHDYLHPCCLRLLQCPSDKQFFKGDQGPWNLLSGHLDMDLLKWLQGDTFFMYAQKSPQEFGLSFQPDVTREPNTKRQKLEVLPERKHLQVAGYVGQKVSGKLRGLCVNEPFPAQRVPQP